MSSLPVTPAHASPDDGDCGGFNTSADITCPVNQVFKGGSTPRSRTGN